MRDVGNRDQNLVAPAGQGFGIDRIIMVTRIIWVDGHQGDVTEIFARG